MLITSHKATFYCKNKTRCFDYSSLHQWYRSECNMIAI